MPVFSATAIQISGVSTPSMSNVTIACCIRRGGFQKGAALSSGSQCGLGFKLTEICATGTALAVTEELMMKNCSIIRHSVGAFLLLLCFMVHAEPPWMLNTLARFDIVSGQNSEAGLAERFDEKFYVE